MTENPAMSRWKRLFDELADVRLREVRRDLIIQLQKRALKRWNIALAQARHQDHEILEHRAKANGGDPSAPTQPPLTLIRYPMAITKEE